MENIFRRLETYTNVPQTAGMTDVIIKVMVEVLRILAIATEEIKQNRASKSIYIRRWIKPFDLLFFRKIPEEACGKEGYRGCAAKAREGSRGGSSNGSCRSPEGCTRGKKRSQWQGGRRTGHAENYRGENAGRRGHVAGRRW